MSVDGAAVRDRLRLAPDSAAAVLADQLRPDMPDAEFVTLATAIIRVLSREARA